MRKIIDKLQDGDFNLSENVHEPIQAALLAGLNQLYAKAGANPRDTDSHTEQSRGFNPETAKTHTQNL